MKKPLLAKAYSQGVVGMPEKVVRVKVISREISYDELEPKIRELIESGAMRCAICKGPIGKDNIGVVFSEDDLTWAICTSCPGTLRTTFLPERGMRLVVGLDERDAVKL